MSHERIPILYLAPWVDYGGSDKGTIDWFRWIDRSRFAPSLITTQPSENSRLGEVVPFAEEVWPLPELFTGQRYAALIVDFIVSRRIELVHVMNSRLAFDLLPDLRSLEHRPRIVVQLHVEEQTRDGYVRYVTTRYGNLVDAFSVTSRHLGEAVYGYGVPRDRIVTIPTGVDSEREFCPERITPRGGLSPDLVHILFPGRLVEQKDPLLMVEVARELDARGVEFRIHVVGRGELEPEVRRRVAAYGLNARVSFEPPTQELASWYAASDLLLMTSVYEGIPYVIYEALAMRVPVVVPALPGNLELMGGAGGTLVAQRDAASAYADALEPLIRDAALRDRVGEQARASMLRGHTLRQMADSHAALYERLLAREPRRHPDPIAAGGGPAISFVSRSSRGRPKVSVITPCFNHGRWLRECVESVRQQTYPALEMIVVDDASHEQETLAYLEQLAEGGDVRVVRMERNRGPSAARNHAVELASGRYILPLDADNLLLPEAIERLVQQLQGAGENVGYVYPTIQYFGNREDYFEPPSFNAWSLTRGNYIDTCALLDREVFDHGLRYPEEVVLGHEDWDFFLALAARGVRGVPAVGKTLRYRKHGFTRSDLVESGGGAFQRTVAGRHPALFDDRRGRTGGDSQYVRTKARWAPALAVIALAPVELGGPASQTVRRAARDQHLQDFELWVAADGEQARSTDAAPLRQFPRRLQGRPAEALAYALECTEAPHVALTYGTGAELLGDPGSLERLVRVLEHGTSSGVVGFADVGTAGRFPWRVLSGQEPGLEPHSLAISRRHLPLRSWPRALDATDPLGDLGRWYQLRRISIEWRHLPAVSDRRARPAGRRIELPNVPRSVAEKSDRHSRINAEASLPRSRLSIQRWEALSDWAPPSMTSLVRHRHVADPAWTMTSSRHPPPGYKEDRCLGLLHWMAFEGTARIVTDPEQCLRAVPRGGEPDAVERERTLGYADQVAFPLLEPLMLCRHAETGALVPICGEDDPLRAEVHWPQLAVLGWIERWPVNPRSVPGSGETTAWLRGLVRAVDYRARRHRVAIGSLPPGAAAWELGALLDRDPGDGIPAWVDASGCLHTERYEPARYPFSPRRIAHWIAAPAGWRGFGRPGPRARAIARRSLEATRQTLLRPEVAGTIDRGAEPAGWLLPEDGPHRIPILSAIHATTSDQLVTRDASEARELGYESLRLLGYALAIAPLTGRLERPRIAVPWGSRFGEVLTHGEDRVS